jgi:hypothetical protein
MSLRALFPWRHRRPVDEEAPVLDALLAQAARAAGYADRVEWVRDALRWIGQDIEHPSDEAGIARAHARVRFLLQLAARGTSAGLAVRHLLAQLMAEVDLAQKDFAAAGRRLQLALRMNPKSVGGLFLSAYTAWKRNAGPDARAQLSAAQAARGPDWKPKGSVAEGDVKTRMFNDAGFLAPYWEQWNGGNDPRAAFAEMDRMLGKIGSAR